jgi:hypothetical protein
MELNKKLINFSDHEYNDDNFDFSKIKIISLPMERRFSFRYKNKEELSLNVGEIKELPDHFRNYFKEELKKVSEFIMYLLMRGNTLKNN